MKATVEPDQVPELLVYTDSNFASCTQPKVHQVLFWSSKKQSSLARSITEAELIACASALLGEALNLHTMIESLAETRIPIKFQQDNQAAITVISVQVIQAS